MILPRALAPLLLACASVPGIAQDVAVSRVAQNGLALSHLGELNGTRAYSMATTSCNVGNIPIDWIQEPSNRHPVIAQNMFRIHAGRIEQLGQSWLKHGFCAVNENTCGTCQMSSCATLGIGCADTYSSSLNDGRNGGAKSDINPTTGEHSDPYTLPSTGDDAIRGRLQIHESELGLPGAIYLAEAQYVSAHDQLAGNARNNASWLELDTSDPRMVSGIGTTSMGDPAIMAWPLFDPDARVIEVLNVDEGGRDVHGYYFLGWKVSDLGSGLWRYEYALHNFTSKQAAGSFAVPVSCGVTISDLSFKDVDYHSGEIYSGADWVASVDADFVRWSVRDPYSRDPDGNALRWGTLYNFGFTADAAPVESGVEIGLFEPGVGSTLTPLVTGPCMVLPCIIETYCESAPNSIGGGAQIFGYGSTSVAANDLQLVTTTAVPGQFGLFYYGAEKAEAPFGDGTRCVGGAIARILPPQRADLLGDVSLMIDNTRPPFDAGAFALTAGATWHFQYWYRDPRGANGSGFNLSDALRITYCP